jgi:NAD(P)-dependent dehydrogenase (short-subunit alcohol dehydrogenase family)
MNNGISVTVGSSADYLMRLFDLEGKVAALTGAGGHLVSEMAAGMAKAGMKVVVMDIEINRAKAVAERLQSQGHVAMALEIDVTQKNDWERTLQQIDNTYGTVDVLVNGAGINAPTPFLEIPRDEWDRILAVQLTGTMLGCQVFGARMVERKRGSIINISSASAGPPLSKAFSYSVAKAGVVNLTQNLAREWGTSGVRVNALRPGFFPTEWNKNNFLSPQRIDAILTHTPMKRFGVPAELVGAVLWLCSEAAAFVTGSEITVDGGFSAMTI